MSLYSVSFTTKKIVTRYGAKREVISSQEMEIPVVMHGLPRTTAEAYSGCDNFKMSIDYGSNASIDTRGSYRAPPSKAPAKTKATKPAETRAERAARSGDLGAAIDGR